MAKKGPIDLNIINRSTSSTHWVTENGVITPDSLTERTEQSSDNASALNSLPTPFARFFVAREAFRRVAEANSKNKSNPNLTLPAKAGYAYEQLVSDCLDLYELLFNLKYHRNIWNGKEDIEIREWKAQEELASLSRSMPKLYSSVKNYYDTDIKEEKLFFLVYKNATQEYLLGSSSPFTGWVTPPDLDKTRGRNGEPVFMADYYKDVRIRRKSGGYYFDGKKLFEDRDVDFQNYMFNELFGDAGINYRLAYVTSYVKSFEHNGVVNHNYHINITHNVSIESSVVIVNGLNMGQSDEMDINSFFQSHIIRIPYRLSPTDFTGITYEMEDLKRDYDFLIPLNEQGLSLLAEGATYSCQIRKSDILVKLSYNGRQYQKVYEKNPLDQNHGTIKDLAAEKKYFNLGLFPNILSPLRAENNYFKIAVTESDYDSGFITLNIDKCGLKFFKKDDAGRYEEIEEAGRNGHALNGVYEPVVRTRQSDSNRAGTKYYEVFNTDFDAIEIDIEGARGFVLPVWRRAQQTADSYTYAIDIGTSNTFISRVRNGENESPVQLEMTEAMTSFMHDYTRGRQYPLPTYVEQAMPEGAKDAFVTEFAPSFIDGHAYDFPIRTALCRVRGAVGDAALFDNTNIAFFYEKALQGSLQEILTDIKWEDNRSRLDVFIRELMLIIKADILQHNGQLSQTNLVRFRPLSFGGNIRQMYDDLWNSIPKEVFGVSPRSIECFTESEAPYYYFIKRNIITNTEAVTVIDIGGGSTDFVYFKGNRPLIASSVHFGCDELWGEGHIAFGNARENGIFKKYAQALTFSDDRIAEINSAMIVDQRVSAKNIINFWLNNQRTCAIGDNLRKEYIPLFLYHFNALIYYIASMYKYKGLDAPRSIVFSGNGSHYIDNFISRDPQIIQFIVKTIFDKVYGHPCDDIYVTLPDERKESTCYGGLYRNQNAANVPEVIYHGVDREYETAADLINDPDLRQRLMARYREMNDIYKSLVSQLKNRGIIDKTTDVTSFTSIVNDNYENNFVNHFQQEVVDRYQDPDDVCNDAVFFIPVIDKIFELTNAIR